MPIQNLLYRKSQNALQDAGDLDGQIRQDLERLLGQLQSYQTEHLDGKVKGRSNHYDQWTAENQKKIQWIARALELMGPAGQRPPTPMDRIDRETWDSLSAEDREPLVLSIAAREAGKIRAYLPGTVHVERQSFHRDDWYLWSAAARRDAGQEHVWDCWTLNLTTGSLNGGHYGLSDRGLLEALSDKRGIRNCRPETCCLADSRKEE